MKNLLRYLIGGKRMPPSETRFVPAHELALKAVARRLAKQANDEPVAKVSTTAELPVVAEQAGSARDGSVGRGGRGMPSPQPREARRKQRRQSRLKQDVAEAGADAAARERRRPRHQLADIAMYTRRRVT